MAAPCPPRSSVFLFYPDGSFVRDTCQQCCGFSSRRAWLPRRMLTAVPYCADRIAAVAAKSANAVAEYGASVGRRIPELPTNATVVPGHFCPQSRLAAAIAGRSDLRFICPGWDWPSDVAAELDAAANSGRPVALDLADAAWVGRREVEPRDAVRSWAEVRGGSEAGGFLIVGR